MSRPTRTGITFPDRVDRPLLAELVQGLRSMGSLPNQGIPASWLPATARSRDQAAWLCGFGQPTSRYLQSAELDRSRARPRALVGPMLPTGMASRLPISR